MIAKNELKSYLERLVEAEPEIIIQKLEKGSKVRKTGRLAYEIDDIDLDKKLGDFPEGAVPYRAINNALGVSKRGVTGILEVLEQFGDSSELPFSKVLESGIGQCLEKAILVQLSAQKGRESFLINGYIGLDSSVGVEAHAYNIIFKDGEPYLVDAQNPAAKGLNGKVKPYIIPVLGINEEYGEFIVPEEQRLGRTYSVF